ncbi:MAG: hypothetical protein V4490_05575 [Pseudomonadota bacterium]
MKGSMQAPTTKTDETLAEGTLDNTFRPGSVASTDPQIYDAETDPIREQARMELSKKRDDEYRAIHDLDLPGIPKWDMQHDSATLTENLNTAIDAALYYLSKQEYFSVSGQITIIEKICSTIIEQECSAHQNIPNNTQPGDAQPTPPDDRTKRIAERINELKIETIKHYKQKNETQGAHTDPEYLFLELAEYFLLALRLKYLYAENFYKAGATDSVNLNTPKLYLGPEQTSLSADEHLKHFINFLCASLDNLVLFCSNIKKLPNISEMLAEKSNQKLTALLRIYCYNLSFLRHYLEQYKFNFRVYSPETVNLRDIDPILEFIIRKTSDLEDIIDNIPLEAGLSYEKTVLPDEFLDRIKAFSNSFNDLETMVKQCHLYKILDADRLTDSQADVPASAQQNVVKSTVPPTHDTPQHAKSFSARFKQDIYSVGFFGPALNALFTKGTFSVKGVIGAVLLIFIVPALLISYPFRKREQSAGTCGPNDITTPNKGHEGDNVSSSPSPNPVIHSAGKDQTILTKDVGSPTLTPKAKPIS